MPPAVGGGIRYMTVGGVVGAGCIPLPVPETHPDLYKIALRQSYPPSGFDTHVETGIISRAIRFPDDYTDTENRDLYISL